jgi:hypothetical protein
MKDTEASPDAGTGARTCGMGGVGNAECVVRSEVLDVLEVPDVLLVAGESAAGVDAGRLNIAVSGMGTVSCPGARSVFWLSVVSYTCVGPSGSASGLVAVVFRRARVRIRTVRCISSSACWASPFSMGEVVISVLARFRGRVGCGGRYC